MDDETTVNPFFLDDSKYVQYEESLGTTLMKNFPRFGKTKDFASATFAENAEYAFGYRQGILFALLIIVVPYMTWSVVMFVFKCSKSSRFGFLSGKPFTSPEKGDREAFKKWSRRVSRTRFVFVVAGCLVVASAVLMVLMGFSRIDTTKDIFSNTNHEIQDIIDESLVVVDSLTSVMDRIDLIMKSPVFQYQTVEEICPGDPTSALVQEGGNIPSDSIKDLLGGNANAASVLLSFLGNRRHRRRRRRRRLIDAPNNSTSQGISSNNVLGNNGTADSFNVFDSLFNNSTSSGVPTILANRTDNNSTGNVGVSNASAASNILESLFVGNNNSTVNSTGGSTTSVANNNITALFNNDLSSLADLPNVSVDAINALSLINSLQGGNSTTETMPEIPGNWASLLQNSGSYVNSDGSTNGTGPPDIFNLLQNLKENPGLINNLQGTTTAAEGSGANITQGDLGALEILWQVEEMLTLMRDAGIFMETVADERLKNFKNGLETARNYTDVFDDIIDHIDSSAWIRGVISLPVLVVTLPMIISTFTAQFQRTSPCALCMLHWLFLPIFQLWLTAFVLLASLMGLFALSNADFCSGSGSAEKTPESSVLIALNQAGYNETDFMYNAVRYYAYQCTARAEVDPFLTLREYDAEMVQVENTIGQIIENTNEEALGALSILCERDFSTLPSLLRSVRTVLIALDSTLQDVFEIVDCERIVPIYTSTTYEAMCQSNINGLTWLYFCFVVASLMGMIMVTFRSSYQNHVVSQDGKDDDLLKQPPSKEEEEQEQYADNDDDDDDNDDNIILPQIQIVDYEPNNDNQNNTASSRSKEYRSYRSSSRRSSISSSSSSSSSSSGSNNSSSSSSDDSSSSSS